MASLPARQQGQRRTSPPEQSSNAPNSQSQSSPSPVRTRSEDSQTLFLNKPHDSQDQASTDPPQQHTSNSADDASIKKCWICFSDSTEDTPETSPWRSPCPCALEAHEECLLDWIADMESPTNNSRRTNNASSIQCPQCKSEIKLSRPRSYVVDAVRGLERLGSEHLYKGAAMVLFGTVYNASMAWGVHSIYAVFGSEDGWRILRPLILNTVRPPVEFNNASVREVGRTTMALVLDHVAHWRLYIGLPLITPTVILSRTTLADSILPVLPILFFATQTHATNDPLDLNAWPPSAGLAFSILPYVRTIYNAWYRRVLAPREKQWLREIQPRVREEDLPREPGVPTPEELEAYRAHADDEPLFEVRLEGDVWEDDWRADSDEEEQGEGDGGDQAAEPAAGVEVGGDQVAQPAAGGEDGEDEAAPPPVILPQRRANAQNPGPAQPVLPQPAQQPAAAQQQQQGPVNAAPAAGPANAAANLAGEANNRGLSFSVTPIAETILGALLFPTIAGLSGELLKLALPRSWTASPAASTRGVRVAAKGLLQEKWGRSLVGGCLFVALKDAVMLYVRWRMAASHRQRRVVDWTGERKNRS